MKLIDPNITGHLPSLTLSYFNNEKGLNPFYNRLNKLKNYKAQIEEKQKNVIDTYIIKFKTAFYGLGVLQAAKN